MAELPMDSAGATEVSGVDQNRIDDQGGVRIMVADPKTELSALVEYILGRDLAADGSCVLIDERLVLAERTAAEVHHEIAVCVKPNALWP